MRPAVSGLAASPPAVKDRETGEPLLLHSLIEMAPSEAWRVNRRSQPIRSQTVTQEYCGVLRALSPSQLALTQHGSAKINSRPEDSY